MGEVMNKIVYSKYSNERVKKFQIRTMIECDETGNMKVAKSPCTEEAILHVKDMYTNFERLKSYIGDKILINNCEYDSENHTAYFEYLQGNTLEKRMIESINNNDLDTFYNLFDEYLKLINSLERIPFTLNEKFVEIFGDCPNLEKKDYSGLQISDLDLIFENIIINENWNIIDYEWTFDFVIPFNFIIYRAIYYFEKRLNEDEKIKLNLYDRAGIDEEEKELFQGWEASFQKYVKGDSLILHEIRDKIGQPIKRFDDIVKFSNIVLNNEPAHVYYKTPEYSEENSEYILPDIQDGVIHYHIQVPDNCTEIRLDPAKRLCDVYIEKISTNKGDINWYCNGLRIDNRIATFKTALPQLYFIISNSEIQYVDLSIRLIQHLNLSVEEDFSITDNLKDTKDALTSLNLDFEELKKLIQLNLEKFDSIFDNNQKIINQCLIYENYLGILVEELKKDEDQISNLQQKLKEDENQINNLREELVRCQSNYEMVKNEITEIKASFIWRFYKKLSNFARKIRRG